MTEELMKKAAALMQGVPVSLASVSEEGWPRCCVLGVMRADGIRELWFSTGTEGMKTRHFRKNPKASVCYFNGPDSVTLVGDVAVTEDPQLKRDFWEDWMLEHFPEGAGDPGYCLLRFTAREATVWIDKVFETFPVG